MSSLASLDPAPRAPRTTLRPTWRDSRAGRFLYHWWPWLAAILSGLLLTLPLEPWNQEWLCWVALTPLIAALWADGRGVVVPPEDAAPAPPRRWYARLRPRMPRERWARGFFLGYVTGLIFYWSAFHWLTEVTGPGWFILGFYMALYPALFGWFVATVARPWPGRPAPETPAGRVRPAARLLVINPLPAGSSPLLRSRWNLLFAFLGASAWTAQEWLRGLLLSGFGWNDLGVGFHRNIPFLQVAEWTGVGGLSFLAAFVNFILVATVARFVLEVRAHRIRAHFDFTLTIAAVMLVFTFGVRTLQRSQRDAARPDVMIPLRVACVQASIPQTEKWSQEFADSIYRTFDEMSAAAEASRPQLLIWPEACTPYGMYDSRYDTFGFTHGIVKRSGAHLLFGSLDYDFGPDGHAQADYNAAMLLVPGDEARRVQTYRKLHLVPFGEYIPGREAFPLFAYLVGDKVPGDFGVGTEPGVFDMENPDLRLAPLVCFEDTIGRVAREPVLLGAQLLINITNDGWFGHSAANRQQMAEAVFRTVENRRPLVACANTGVTAFVDRDGRVTQIFRGSDGTVFGRGILSGVVPVPANPALTFYTRHGEAFSAGCAAVMGLAWFLVMWAKLRRLTIPRRRAVASEVAAP